MLVTFVQETKLSVNSFLKVFTDFMLPSGAAMVELSLSSSIPSPTGFLMVTYSPTSPRWKSWLLKADFGERALPFFNVNVPRHRPAPRFWLPSGGSWTSWFSVISRPTIPPGSPVQEIIGQWPEGKYSTKGSLTRNSRLQTLICLPSSPSRASTHRWLSPFWMEMSSLARHDPPSQPPHNHASPSSVTSSPHYGRFGSTLTCAKADWEGYTVESVGSFAETS